MITVWGQCLSDTKNFKNKMTHLSSWGKFLSGSEVGAWDRTRVSQVCARGGFHISLAVCQMDRRCSANYLFPAVQASSDFMIWLITHVRSRHTVRPDLMNY